MITGAQQISRIRQLAGVQQEPLPVVCAEPPFTFDLIGSIILVMNTAAKLLSSMRRNPLDWQISQLQSVARQHGIDWRHNGTSHCVFIRGDGQTLPVPAHRPIKPIYIKKFVELVDGA